jgi:hypothetical protein
MVPAAAEVIEPPASEPSVSEPRRPGKG